MNPEQAHHQKSIGLADTFDQNFRWEPVCQRFIGQRFVEKFFQIHLLSLYVAPFLVLLVFVPGFNTGAEMWLWVVMPLWLVLVALIGLFVYYECYRRGFVLRTTDLICKLGLIEEMHIVIPFSRVQHLVLQRSMFDKLFRISSVKIYTAGASRGKGYSRGVFVLRGLTLPTASKLRDYINRRVIEISSSSHEHDMSS